MLTHDDQIGVLLFLMVAFIFKHFIADYLLQANEYMGRKTAARGWQLPLILHSAVHGVMTAIILYPPCRSLALLFGLADMILHLVIDFWKARMVTAKPGQYRFWIALGWDQTLHHLTYVALAYTAVHFHAAHYHPLP